MTTQVLSRLRQFQAVAFHNGAKAAMSLFPAKRLAAVLAATMLLVPSAQAAQFTWTGNTSTAWGAGTNWSPTTGPANSLTTDTALFDSVIYTNSPAVTTSTSINGITVGDGTTSTGALTITETSAALAIGASGITINANSGATTFNATGTGSTQLGASQSWANNSSSLLTVGAISNVGNITPFTLTINGSGLGGTTLGGIISDGGTTGTTALVINTTGGSTTLSGANTFTGGVTLTSGTLLIGSTKALGAAGGTFTINGGTIDNTTAASITLANANPQLWNSSFTYGGTKALSFGAGAITLDANVTLTNSGASLLTEGGAITGAHNLIINNSSTGGMTLSNANAVNIGGTLTNSGGGTNTTTISGIIGTNVTGVNENSATSSLTLGAVANTFTSGLNIQNGTVIGGANAATFGAGAINLGNGSSANATLQTASTQTYANAINTVAGSTGTLTITNNGVAGNATFSGLITLASGTTLTDAYSGTASNTLSGGITGTGTVIVNNSSTLATTLSGTVINYTGNLVLNANGAGGITVSAASINNRGTITNSGAGAGTTTIGAVGDVLVAGITNITENSTTSKLVLGNANNSAFIGTITVTAGTLQIGGASALDAANTVTVNSGATFDDNNNTLTIAGLNDVSGSGGTVTNSVTTARTLTLGGSGNYSFAGVITAATPADLGITVALTGGGTQTLSGANTYTGLTTVNSGTLQLNATTATSNVLVSTNALTLGGGTLGLQGSLGSVGTVTQTLSGTLTLTAGTFSTIVLADAGSATGTSLTTATLATPANGTVLYLSLANAGTGALTLGTTTAAAFTPWAVVTDATGTGFGSINASHQLVRDTTMTVLTGSSNAAATNFTTNPLTDTSAGEYSGGTLTMAGSASVNSLFITAGTAGTLDLGGGTFTIASNALGMTGGSNYIIQHGQLGANANSLTITQVGTGTLTINSTISGTTGGFTKAGSGILIIGGANTYTGTTSLIGGTLQLSGAGTLGSSSSTLTVASGVLDLNGTNQSVGTLNGAASVTSGVILNNDSGTNVTLTIGNGNGSTAVATPFAGLIANNSSGTGTIALTKVGTGALLIGGLNNTYSGATTILNGSIILTGALTSGNTPLGTGNLLVGDTSGLNSAALYMNLGTFSHNVTVQGGSAGEIFIGDNSVNNVSGGFTYAGNISLNRNVALVNDVDGGGGGAFSGNITDASGSNTVSLIANGGSLAGIVVQNITGTGNTWGGGTVVDGGNWAVSSNTGVTVGTGNVVISGGELTLGSFFNVATGKTVLINPGGALGIGAAFANLGNLIASGSSGGDLNLNSGTNYSLGLTMSNFGDGTLFLGGNTGIYSATSLGAGTGNIYRLGGGGGTTAATALTVTNGVLADASGTAVVIGSTLAGAPYEQFLSGYVILSAANTYTGGTTVNLSSTLQGAAQTSGTPFGSTTAAITLNGGNLVLAGIAGTATTTNVGNLNFDGGTALTLNVTSPSTVTTFSPVSLARNNQGTLAISASGTANTLGTNSEVILSNSTNSTALAATSVNGMVAPYFTDGAGDFLNYSAANGFSLATTSATFGTTTNVKTAAAILSTSQTVNSLVLTGSLTNTTSGAAQTLTITSGGLSATTGAITIGSTTATQAVNLAFGNAEAVIYAVTPTTTLTIDNVISNTIGSNATPGLTKSGAGILTLNGVNTFTGLVTIDQGKLNINSDSALGNANNGVLINGGTLGLSFANNSLSSTRTIILGNNGGTIATTPNSAPFTDTINSQITGTGAYLSFLNSATAGDTSTLTLTNTSNNFTAPIIIDQSSSATVNLNTLSINADSELGNASNSVQISDLATLQVTGTTSSARAMSFTNGGGNIDVTGSNVYTNSGVVSGDGNLTKIDTGTLLLSGADTLSGSTIVSGGNLTLTGSLTNTAIIGIGAGATFQFGNATATGSVSSTAPINDNGTVAFDRSNAFTVANTISGSGSVSQIGSGGSAALTAANTYTGGTSVSAGTLYANNTSGSATGTGAVSVGSGGTFGGLGFVAPTTTTGTNAVSVAQGGLIAPGGVQPAAAPGAMANGNLTLDPTNVTGTSQLLNMASSVNSTTPSLTFALGTGNATSGSKIIVAGSAGNVMNFNSDGGSGTVISINDLVGGGLTLNQNYVLIQGNGSTTFEANGQVLAIGNADNLVAANGLILGGLELLAPNTAGNFFSQWYSGSQLFLVGDNIDVEVIPEPSSWAMMIGGLALLVVYQRRKSKHD